MTLLGVGIVIGSDNGSDIIRYPLSIIHQRGAQPLPVLRSALDGEEVLRQTDEALHIGRKGFGTGLGQIGVVLVRALGRGVAVNRDVGNRGEGVATHHIDGLQHLGQLGGIATIGGADVGLVDHEVEEGTTAKLACLLLFGLWRHVSQLVMGLVDFLDNGWGRQLHRLLLADEIGNVQGQFRRADIVLVAAAILVVFDYFTIYEYAYNGKVLGYVNEQEEVTDVLDIAGKQMSNNSSAVADVKFVANQNITFNPVDGRGKSTDDSDTVVNKLIYMTDIETEAYAVYDGDKVVAIVKDQNDADELLLQTKADLSTPDRGMELVSADFSNELSIKPVNVLLGSVQSNVAAQKQMTNGGEMNTYHIVEEGETLESLAAEFGVEVFEIYDEENKEPVTQIEQGDRVCIRCHVDPVSVKMVETGRLKEVIEYKTIKKETDEYYKGDSYLKQEGQNGIQIFEGTITKVGGTVTDRKETAEPEIIKKKKDKIILVGTAERPKTAATGTFIVPLDHYVVTSEWGGRWGRMHEGMDLAAPTGTPIHASDGGKIIKANYWSGHGLCVEIDHGNGVITRYSHCSAVFVNIGDLVYQGQHIANVGNTGHSFGSHCHFEVRVNGSSQNPRKYINP